MSIELRKAESRLENVQKVKPILAALRTISLGSWQMARNRRQGLTAYTDRLLGLLPLVVPHLPRRHGARLRRRRRDQQALPAKRVLLVLGAERGLCGQYNAGLLDELARSAEATRIDLPLHLGDAPHERGPSQSPGGSGTKTAGAANHTPPHRGGLRGGTPASAQPASVDIVALGTRLIRDLKRAGYAPADERALSITSLPSFELAYELASAWLARYEAYELEAVDVVYNADLGAGTYGPTTVRLIPPALPPPDDASASTGLVDEPGHDETPTSPAAVILETDPVRLYVRIVEQWTAIALYRLLLEAALTEHSARFQLMESANQNADELVDELMLAVLSARRQAITRQMQELAVSAGLLSDR